MANENQTGKILPWDTEQFNQVVNDHVKKVTQQVVPPAPGIGELTPAQMAGKVTVEPLGRVGKYIGENVEMATPFQNPYGENPGSSIIPGSPPASAPVNPVWRQPTSGLATTGGGLPPTNPTEVVPTPASGTGGVTSIVPTGPMQEGGGPPIGMRQSFYNEAPEAPGGSFTGGGGAGGVVPANAPSGGGIGGFVDSEMVKIERDRAEYAAYRNKMEENQLAGLGEAGQDKLRARMAAMAPYLEGVSKGRRAHIMAGIVGEHIKGQDELSKAVLAGRAGTEAATISSGIRAGSVREAAMIRAQSEAQKMGIDVAKLGLEQQKLGLTAGNYQSEARLREAQINNYLVQNNQIEPLKLALQGAKNLDERTKIQRGAWDDANSLLLKQKIAAINATYAMTPDSKEAIQAKRDAFMAFTSGHMVGSRRFPFQGQIDEESGAVFDGSKWTKPQENQ